MVHSVSVVGIFYFMVCLQSCICKCCGYMVLRRPSCWQQSNSCSRDSLESESCLLILTVWLLGILYLKELLLASDNRLHQKTIERSEVFSCWTKTTFIILYHCSTLVTYTVTRMLSLVYWGDSHCSVCVYLLWWVLFSWHKHYIKLQHLTWRLYSPVCFTLFCADLASCNQFLQNNCFMLLVGFWI